VVRAVLALVPLAIPLVLGACSGPAPRQDTSKSHWWQKATPASEVPVASQVAPTPVVQPGAPGLITDEHRAVAAKILARAVADNGAFDKLRYLTDRVGHRLSGSRQLEQAIAWAAEAMRADGHDVRTEKVMVPHWERGFEAAELVAPVKRPLRILGLGMTVATPKGGLTAPVVVVKNWQELEAKGKAGKLKGAIVLYDVRMPAWTLEGGSGYGDAAEYRWKGPSEAAKHGAVAVLIRSLTARSLATPHTGTTGFLPDMAKLPAAALTVEDEELLVRLAADGEVRVKLTLSGRMLPEAPSANVIGELRGRDKPDEVVVIGGHIDSWDVGQGAHDDGAGCVMMMQALTVLRELGLQPRRTIRVVLFTNEENGIAGARGYFAAHKDEVPKHVLAVEADSGGFAPQGFRVEVTGEPDRQARVKARITEIASLLASIGATKVVVDGAGTDIGPLVAAGVPGIGVDVDPRTYFDYHHPEADTLDKVVPADLAKDVAAVAVLAFLVADLPERIDAP
jgi:carboxypeptidase Q